MPQKLGDERVQSPAPAFDRILGADPIVGAIRAVVVEGRADDLSDVAGIASSSWVNAIP